MSAPSTPADTASAAPIPHEPFVPATTTMTELTVRAVVIGSVLGIIFAMSSVYLGLKVGLTVSASIPVAVLSITLFRWLGKAFGARPATILENNIVQTTGSAGESIAAGIAFTLPSLLVMGFDMELVRILLVGLLGGLLGVLMMIPLRHGLMVKEHGKLAFPEGTACADVLIVGEQGGTNAKTVFLGFGVGFGYTFLSAVLHIWGEVSSITASFWGKLKDWSIGFEATPAMMGVGFIIGPRVAANMLAGGMLAFFVLVPLLHAFGDSMGAAMYPSAEKLVRDMSPGQIRNNYILFIGAGAVATGGFIALARAIPTIVQAFRRGLGNIERKGAETTVALPRTERDLSMRVVLFGSLGLALAIAVAPVLNINPLAACLIVLFGFFFVTVSSRITGEIGSSSNPISGMTVATLLLTCGLFVAIGWTGIEFKAMALTTAALVCVAASNGGTIAQDLKTGHLVGATPRLQQLSILVGVITSAIVIGFTLQLLNDGQTTFKPISTTTYDVPAAALADAATMQGPDDKAYKVYYLHDSPGTDVPRGKYLVDETGKLAFYVDSSIADSNNYPWRLAAQTFKTPVAAPADAPTELGLDRQPYRAVDLKEPQGDVPRGHWLVDAGGNVRWGAEEPVAKYDAPKAQLFRLIIDGTMGGQLPWGLVLIGMFLAIMMELVGVQSLPFAVGLYLPISTSGGIFIGGLVRRFVDKKRKGSAAEAEFSPGVLMASGLIAGGAIAGVLYGIFEGAGMQLSLAGSLPDFFHDEAFWPLVPFAGLAALLYWVGTKSEKS